MKKKTKYKRKRGLHGGEATAKVSKGKLIKASLLETGRDLIIGVIGGGIAGAIVGRPSLIIGVGVTSLGHYAKKPTLASFGIGMMAAGFVKNSSTGGLDGFNAEEIKARLTSLKDSFSHKLFLDKFIKKTPEETTSGMGAVQYYDYPHQSKELDFSALDRLHSQVVQSGIEYKKSMQGIDTKHQSSATEIERPIYGGEESEIDFTTPSY